MDILKAFSLNGEACEINIQGTLENPLFQANQIGKLLGLVQIRKNLIDFGEDEKVGRLIPTLGGLQETIFLTEIGLYRLLGRSIKPIASVFQKWMINTIKEIRITGIYQLQKEKEVDKKLMEYNCAVINHNTLLKAYFKKSVVYICKLKEVEDKFVIKIGSSQNVKERMSNIANNCNLIEPLLLDIFECEQYTKFERFLHHHDFIKNYKYGIEIKNGEVSKETYLVNEEQYNEINKIITATKQNFQANSLHVEELRNNTEKMRQETEQFSIKKMELECENNKFKLQQKMIELEIKNLEKQQRDKKDEEKEDNKYDDNTTEEKEENIIVDVTTSIFSVKKRVCGSNIPKVYQYNPSDLTNYINIYDSPAIVEREIADISPAPLRASAKNNTIYKGYRWIFISRDELPSTPITPTIDTKHKSPDVLFVAMIDIKRTKILAVYKNQKEATSARNMKCNSFNRAINQDTLSSGHYWNYFDKCSDEMKIEYLSHSKLPEKYISPCGKCVQQIDPKTNQIMKTYSSNREVVKLFQISSTTLRQISKTGEIHNGYRWKII